MKLLYFDLEHGSKSLGSPKDIEKIFGYPMLESGSWKEFTTTIRQLYGPHKIMEEVKIGNTIVKQEKTEVRPTNKTEISGIVVDTISELSKKYQRSLTLEDGTMKLKEWGKLKNNLDKMTSKIKPEEKTQKVSNDFSGQDLSGRNFSGKNLVDYDFSGANLYQASFQNANLKNTVFDGADIRGANFIGSKSLQSYQLEHALMDKNTKIPDSLIGKLKIEEW